MTLNKEYYLPYFRCQVCYKATHVNQKHTVEDCKNELLKK